MSAPQLPGAAAPAVMEVPWIPDGYLLTTLDFAVPAPVDWFEHSHSEFELLWAHRGMATLEADGRVWAVPPELGVWIPANLPHRASAEAGAEVRATYFTETASRLSGMPDRVTGVAVSEPLRTLLQYNLHADLEADARLRLQHVILDMIAPSPQVSFDLSMPTSAHLRSIARTILADPADKRTTSDWAAACGMHPRTLARQFTTETGISFTQWRILARLQLAIRELSAGHQVARVSRTLGYRNTSTFIDHFRTLTGQTPAAYTRNGTALLPQ